MRLLEPRRQFSIMLDYEFGKGTSRALPKSKLTFVYSKKSGRLKHVFHDGKLLATIRPNGAISPTMLGATLLMSSKAYARNSVVVKPEAVEFVSRGKSVFCKFVKEVGSQVLPGGEVVVLAPDGRVIAVGRTILHGDYIRQFKHGVAVKVRGALT
jgi:uncharacterized protein with predicted RNA binding PUA domain